MKLSRLVRQVGKRIPRRYDVFEATGHHSSTETYLFSV
ncbi:MAG: hypothetical protein QOD09_591 [Bradyrhizobium sp.]|jgi:hypothetical protein|nr:hypothetical protein [Bradyrhizobium sp.]MEA2950534.1 hypothetical protein [Alphaproteobacteria bacterium]